MKQWLKKRCLQLIESGAGPSCLYVGNIIAFALYGWKGVSAPFDAQVAVVIKKGVVKMMCVLCVKSISTSCHIATTCDCHTHTPTPPPPLSIV